MKKISKWIAFSLTFMMVSCVSLTIHVHFPTKEIEQAAEEIEARVRSGQGVEDMQSMLDRLQSVPHRHFSLSFGAREAFAAEDKLDIKIQTPIIKKIITSRTKRYKKQLEPHLDKGTLGEGMDGLLAIRDKTGLDLKAFTALKKLVKEENKDRESLYKEILQANKLEISKENSERVGKLFAVAIQKTMKEGHWYQVKKDKWEKKKKEIKK